MNNNVRPTANTTPQTLHNLQDGAKALAAIGRLEIQDIEARLLHRLSEAARRMAFLAGVALALTFCAVLLSQAALDGLMLRLAPWQAHLAVGAGWATVAGLMLVLGRPRLAGQSDTAIKHPQRAAAEQRLAVEEDRLKTDLAMIRQDAATWFGLRPRLARWLPLSAVAGVSAALVYVSRTRRPRHPL